MSNILFISPTGTLDNGAEISILNLMRTLKNVGHEIYVVAPQGYSKSMEYKKELSQSGIKLYLISALKWWWHDAPMGGFGSVNQQSISIQKVNYKIVDLIKKNKIDLVITNTVNMPQGAVAAAISQIPHVWLIHEFPEGEFSYYASKIPFIEQNSDEIFAVQGELNKKIQTLISSKKIGQFIPYSNVKSSELKKGQNTRIVSIGRITKRKNQLELIKAFSKIDRNNMELVLIGGWDEPYKQECDFFIKKNHVRNVVFVGNVSDPWECVSDKDICVLPSTMETFGLVYIEALLKGVPVIVSDNLGFKSVYNMYETGKMYSLGNEKELLANIFSYMDRFDEVKKIFISRSDYISKKYTLENSYCELIELLNLGVGYKEKDILALNTLLTIECNETKVSKLIENIKFLEIKVWNKVKKLINKRNI
ncbi:glycosyltransferase family 4 protein [Enterococcus nangangensis]|uniref:glycosyltransferase family 4 protein n=1 Tax=Enterococcus nangangensis TaxID=2559926 RepID=UPI0010F5E651|nr:glycosyltransferase family 4 protein [Enterococcus nangangensis]